MLTVARPVAVVTSHHKLQSTVFWFWNLFQFFLLFPFQTNEQVSVRIVIGAKQQIGSQTETTNKEEDEKKTIENYRS